MIDLTLLHLLKVPTDALGLANIPGESKLMTREASFLVPAAAAFLAIGACLLVFGVYRIYCAIRKKQLLLAVAITLCLAFAPLLYVVQSEIEISNMRSLSWIQLLGNVILEGHTMDVFCKFDQSKIPPKDLAEAQKDAADMVWHRKDGVVISGAQWLQLPAEQRCNHVVDDWTYFPSPKTADQELYLAQLLNFYTGRLRILMFVEMLVGTLGLVLLILS